MPLPPKPEVPEYLVDLYSNPRVIYKHKSALDIIVVDKDKKPVPKHKLHLSVGEKIVIKDYTYEVKYVGETSILLEPIGIVEIKAKE